MSSINFPDNPQVGDVVYIGTYKFIWTGSAWDRELINVQTIIDSSVNSTVGSIVGNAPDTLDTLDELAQALSDDADFANTVANALALKATQADLDTLSGVVDGKAQNFDYDVTILVADWTGSSPVTATKAVVGLEDTDNPVVDLDWSDIAFANVEDTLTEFRKVYRGSTSLGNITLYATEAPTIDLPIRIKVVK
jgi:hypothetical protein